MNEMFSILYTECIYCIMNEMFSILYTENTYMHTNLYDIISQKTGNLHQHCRENVRSCIVPLLGVYCLLHLQIQVPSNQESQAAEIVPAYQ